MADILRSDVYNAYVALGRKPKHVSRHYSRNGIYKAQLGELYCRMPDCDMTCANDGQLQRHLDTAHGSIEWNGAPRGTYRGKDLMNFYNDLMKYEAYPGNSNNGGQLGGEGVGILPPEQPRRSSRKSRPRLPHRLPCELEDDDDDEEEFKMAPTRTSERPTPPESLRDVDNASELPTPPNQVNSREQGSSIAAEVPMPHTYEKEEQELESKRKEMRIKRRLLELELEEMQLERQQAALKKRKAEQ